MKTSGREISAMKKLFIIASISIVSLATAQGVNSIKLKEQVRYTDPTPLYRASTIVTTLYRNNYNGDGEIPLEVLIEEYEQQLVEKGVDLKQVKKDEKGFITLKMVGLKGIIYRYETKSLDSLLKFLDVWTKAVETTNCQYVVQLDYEKQAKLIQNALGKARKRATEIALKKNKKLGKIISITNSYDGNEWVGFFHETTTTGELIFDVTVSFELIDQ